MDAGPVVSELDRFEFGTHTLTGVSYTAAVTHRRYSGTCSVALSAAIRVHAQLVRRMSDRGADAGPVVSEPGGREALFCYSSLAVASLLPQASI